MDRYQKIERIKFSAGRVLGKPVAVLDRADWHRFILPGGEPAKLAEVPSPISGVTRTASIVAVIAYGYSNPKPGIDLVRYDPIDAPHIYNIDHYTVIQTLCLHSQYRNILSIAKVPEDDELHDILRRHVFIIGPEKPDHHWVEELPGYIKNAKANR
jgi:hypothetical protein